MQESFFAQSGKTVIRLNGHITAANAATVRQQLTDFVSSQNAASCFVDMSQVESLDSTGLMTLVSTLTLAQRLNKQFSLLGVSPSVRIVFELTQLDRVFEIVDSYPQAAIA